MARHRIQFYGFVSTMLAILGVACPGLAAQSPCLPLSINDQIHDLLQDGKPVGGEGAVMVRLDGQAVSAFVTIVRLGPADAVKRRVLNFLTLDLGAQGSFEASLHGDLDATGLLAQPARAATFEGNAKVLSGTQRFAGASGLFYVLLQNDFAHPISVLVNGMICPRAR